MAAVGTDLSPVATLAGRLLADFALRDWSEEPPLPIRGSRRPAPSACSAPRSPACSATYGACSPRSVIAPPMLWTSTTPAAPTGGSRGRTCGPSPFPATSASAASPWSARMTLRYPLQPHRRSRPVAAADHRRERVAGARRGRRRRPSSPPSPPPPADKGKSARCLFCGHAHSLDTVKAQGRAEQYRDDLLAVAEELEGEPQGVPAPHRRRAQGRRGRRSEPDHADGGLVLRGPGRAHSERQPATPSVPAATGTRRTAT